MKVIKRNGKKVDFDSYKIHQAIKNVFKEFGAYELELVENLTAKVEKHIKKEYNEPHVEQIQDIVEEVLLEAGYIDMAREYIKYREKHKQKRKEWLKKEFPLSIWTRKYQYDTENFEQFFDRVAAGNEAVKRLVKQKRFLGAGRILANRGLQKYGQKVTYSNCYVTKSPKDNLESIFNSAKEMARTFSYGGGTGCDVSKLRPRGAKVNNAAKTTTGPISFLDIFDVAAEKIGQEGRRAALMLTMDIKHPDIFEFIEKKTELEAINKANMSVKVSDGFMEKADNGEKFKLEFDVKDTDEKIEKEIDADRLMNKIAYANWYSGEPGMLFWDRMNDYYMLSEDENHQYETTNPCGEKPLLENESCNLGSINLAEFVKNPYSDNAKFDLEGYKKAIKEAVIYLNEILDEGADLHPLKEQQEQVKKWRPIGLGVMGLGSMFLKLGIRYGSDESIRISDQLGQILFNTAAQQSARLAKEKGGYPAYSEKILESKFFKLQAYQETYDMIQMYGLRNSELLSIAPTGSISNICDVTGGIEPVYDITYTRKTESLHGESQTYEMYDSNIKKLIDKKNIDIAPEDVSKDDLPYYVVTAHDLDYKERIDVQAAWQRWVDSSISSTINLPNEATVKDIKDLYFYAWKQGLKGVTVYRDGCARTGILKGKENKGNKKEMTHQDWLEMGLCPECQSKLSHTGGCTECKNCGYSACSL